MAAQTEYVSKTQHYLRVKKPLLERQRRARMNKCLNQLKELIAEFQGNDNILRLDKAEMLESALAFMKLECKKSSMTNAYQPTDSFRHGFMNAVNEVSRVMAGTPGMSVNMGKAVMTHLGREFNRLLHAQQLPHINTQLGKSTDTNSHKMPLSPASSGYCSDSDERQSTTTSPVPAEAMWRPW